ncbi:hypothetical protein Micbo1qcDRAFT_202540 [Microdochium bolleyi]|uniref:Zn(2)-C6 fungal-type domain-containing protein n=1 Tax=Microdochium bolleyi TaxID=196109 RepID=A0A136JC14_9PEZI|nr:hypothetical protein Micbo1qcDRAFT_202540 [Microdochium bolleyi]
MPRVFKRSCDEARPVCGQCSRAGRFCDTRQREIQIQREHPVTAAAGAAAAKKKHQHDPDATATAVSPCEALRTSQAADFFQHYITALAPWYDLSDGDGHFGVQVPVLALDEPLLFNALMALSAMHIAKTTMPSARPAAEVYHGACIRALIGLTEVDKRLLESGIALAATCLLRSYEILAEDSDPNRHLRGAYSLASQPHGGFEQRHLTTGRLLIQGFWNYLREDITFSLFGECPLKIDLASTYIPPSATGSDHDHLNNISTILGNIINGIFGSSVPRTEDACALASGPLSRAQLGDLIGLASLYKSGFCESVNREDFLEAAAMEVCGLAFTSNSPAVIVNAFGPMSFCGRFIRSEAVQNDIVRHLTACQKMTGWPVQRIITRLGESWKAELGNP